MRMILIEHYAAGKTRRLDASLEDADKCEIVGPFDNLPDAQNWLNRDDWHISDDLSFSKENITSTSFATIIRGRRP